MAENPSENRTLRVYLNLVGFLLRPDELGILSDWSSASKVAGFKQIHVPHQLARRFVRYPARSRQLKDR